MVAERGCRGGRPGDRNAVGSRRAGWRVVARVEQKDVQQATYAREYAGEVEAELPEICHGILALKGESKELYFKTKDDCYQYLAECTTVMPGARPPKAYATRLI